LNGQVRDYWIPAHHAVEHEVADALARFLAAGAAPDEIFNNPKQSDAAHVRDRH
jgi:hypothetical protein